jgi:hypothetical protein
LLGFVTIIVGIPLSGWGWWVLISRRLSWRSGRRLAFWLAANILASFFFWHGMSILQAV